MRLWQQRQIWYSKRRQCSRSVVMSSALRKLLTPAHCDRSNDREVRCAGLRPRQVAASRWAEAEAFLVQELAF